MIAKSPPDGLCSNGFAHGAVLARFNDEVFTEEEIDQIVEEFKVVCEPREGYNPTDLHRAMCYHGLGHVLIHVTETNVERSLVGCDEIAHTTTGDFRRVCREGVYMQLFQPLEPEDFALLDNLEMQPTRDNVRTFCDLYSRNSAEFDVCWREAWPLFDADIKSAAGIESYCGEIDNIAGREQCYFSAFTINGRHNLGNPAGIQAVCDAVPKTNQGTCYAVAANAYLEEDLQLVNESLALCAGVGDSEVRGQCYEYLANVASFNFHPKSPGLARFCEALPPEWNATCKA